MIRRRATAAGIRTAKIGCHTLRAIGITAQATTTRPVVHYERPSSFIHHFRITMAPQSRDRRQRVKRVPARLLKIFQQKCRQDWPSLGGAFLFSKIAYGRMM